MRKQLILLVDDEPDILDFIEYNLVKEGYDVRTAENGKDGVALAKKLTPDLILLDMMMPEMDGVEACTEIRKTTSLDRTIVAMLTARGEDYSQIAGFDAGADDYILKPVKPRVLISRIQALLRRKKSASYVGGDYDGTGLMIDQHADAFLAKLVHNLLNVFHRNGVDPGKGLIEQHKGRSRRKGSCDFSSAPLPS